MISATFKGSKDRNDGPHYIPDEFTSPVDEFCLLRRIWIINMGSDTWCVATDLTNVFISIPIKKEDKKQSYSNMKQTEIYFYGLALGLH